AARGPSFSFFPEAVQRVTPGKEKTGRGAARKQPAFPAENVIFLLAQRWRIVLKGASRTTLNQLTKPKEPIMAKALSKSQIAAEIANKAGITKKQAVEILDDIAQVAHRHAKNSFSLAGLSMHVLANLQTRKLVM